MQLRLCSAILVLLLIAVPASATCPNGTCPDDRTYVIYGATLGNGPCTTSGNSGFPCRLATSYDPEDGEQLDGTYPIYVWFVTTNADSTCFPNTRAVSGSQNRIFNSPELLSAQEPWFHEDMEYYNESFHVVANGVGSDDGYADDFSAVPDYYPCLTGYGLEQPQVSSSGPGPLDTGGNLYVKDVHGGVGRKTTIILQREVSTVACGHAPSAVPQLLVAVVIGWEAPGCRPRGWPTPGGHSYVPGDTVVQVVRVRHGTGGGFIDAYSPRLIVEWCSKDFLTASPGKVDAADLSAFASIFPVSADNFVWGLCGDGPPNWKYDIAPYGDSAARVDAADLGALASALGDSCEMALSKAGTAGQEREAIMAWFGFTMTDRMVSVTPTRSVPEWELTDPDQLRAAILDPYGYRKNLASMRPAISWSRLKSIYR